MKIDNFILAIIAVIGLAYLFPHWGSDEGPVPLDQIGSIGVSLIFFFYGLKLSPSKLKHGLRNWKLHCLVQLSTFILFPIIVLVFYPFIHSDQGVKLWLSFFFLASLPSTVSSSVVMVSIAKGNIPAAIFNASISGLIGIAITPLWMGLFLTRESGDFNLGQIYIQLLTEILLPVILGLLLQKYWGKFVLKHQNHLSTFDKSIILLIIFKSFAESFEDNVFGSVQVYDLLIISIAGMLLFYVVYYMIGFISRKLNFSIEDQITAQFCGTKKSLVHGTVFSKILFPADFSMGIVLLPLMLFHALQIFIVSIMASKLAQRVFILVVMVYGLSTTTASYSQTSSYTLSDSSGIYVTYDDYLRQELNYIFPSNRKGYTLWPKGFIAYKDLKLSTPLHSEIIKASTFWGYKDHKGRLVRSFNNRHYKVLEIGGMIIYHIYSPTRNAYYFSKSLHHDIYKLSNKNLLKVYSDEPAFLKNLSVLKKNKWLEWDEKRQCNRLNGLWKELHTESMIR
ncbi:bile acid:sodium symporter family protein [Anditalea andensis]|nr:bile acid:sodium symporter family protein [Anditalea andensis]